MITTDELRRTLGPLGIWMPPPARIGIEPESYARAIEAAGFTSVWYPGVNSAADLAAIEPALAATERLVLGTGIASVWTWPPTELAAAAERLEKLYPGRFILGLGVSHAPAVEATGQAYVKPYTKMVQFLDDLPAVPVPVILAALGPKMLELSRDRAAGAHPYFSPPEHTALARETLGPTPLLVPEIAVALAAGDPGAAQARDYAGSTCGCRITRATCAARLYRRGHRRRRERPAHVRGRAARADGVPRPDRRAPGRRRRPRPGAAHRRGRAFAAGDLPVLAELVACSARLRVAKGVCASG